MEAWSYRQITEAAEQQIRASMAKAASSPAPAKYHHQFIGYGAYLLWHRITLGSQAEGDDKRLEKLTEEVQS